MTLALVSAVTFHSKNHFLMAITKVRAASRQVVASTSWTLVHASSAILRHRLNNSHHHNYGQDGLIVVEEQLWSDLQIHSTSMKKMGTKPPTMEESLCSRPLCADDKTQDSTSDERPRNGSMGLERESDESKHHRRSDGQSQKGHHGRSFVETVWVATIAIRATKPPQQR